LITADGSDDNLIKLEGLTEAERRDYSFMDVDIPAWAREPGVLEEWKRALLPPTLTL
jgi:hypothetical protein